MGGRVILARMREGDWATEGPRKDGGQWRTTGSRGKGWEGGVRAWGENSRERPWNPRELVEEDQRGGSSRGVLLREGKQRLLRVRDRPNPVAQGVGQLESPLRRSCQLGSIQGPGGLETAVLEGGAA